MRVFFIDVFPFHFVRYANTEFMSYKTYAYSQPSQNLKWSLK